MKREPVRRMHETWWLELDSRGAVATWSGRPRKEAPQRVIAVEVDSFL